MADALPVWSPDCTECPRGRAPKPQQVPTAVLREPDKPSLAVLFVGQGPGSHEAQRGEAYVGPSGQIFRRVYVPLLDRLAQDQGLDPSSWVIAAANIIRCYAGSIRVAVSEAKTCRQYIARDIDALRKRASRVIVIALGNIAAKVLGSGEVFGARLFSTHHPARILHTKTQHGRARLLNDLRAHLGLVVQHLAGLSGRYVEPPDVRPSRLAVPAFLSWLRSPRVFPLPGFIAVDIETYGILAGVEQAQMHPAASKHFDGRADVICSAFAAIVPPTCDLPPTPPLRMVQWNGQRIVVGCTTDPKQARSLIEEASAFAWITGYNFLFDAGYLAPNPQKTRVLDVQLLAQLTAMQHDGGLKGLARLLGLAGPAYERPDGLSDIAAIARYNAWDAVITALAAEILWHRVGNRARGAAELHADRFAAVLAMHLQGVPVSRTRLDRIHRATEARIARLDPGSEYRGKGSLDRIRRRIEDLIASHPGVTHRTTAKTGQTSTTQDYIEHIVAKTGDDFLRRYLEVVRLRALGAAASSVARHVVPPGLVYPSWQIASASTGGTVSGRITCRNPGMQTLPPLIRSAIRPLPGWSLLFADYSQIELRIAALLVKETRLLDAFREGRDPHAETAQRIGVPRRVAKMVNFLVLYGGGASGLHRSLTKAGIIGWSLKRCADTIAAFFAAYPALASWRQEMVRRARADGFIEDPLLGIRRYTAGLPNHETEKVAVNHVPQCLGAAITLSAQYELLCRGFAPCLNVYDALVLHVPTERLPLARFALDEVLPRPPLGVALCEMFGYDMSWGYVVRLIRGVPDGERAETRDRPVAGHDVAR